MNKRIFSVLALSVMLIGLFVASASAYHHNITVTVSNDTNAAVASGGSIGTVQLGKDKAAHIFFHVDSADTSTSGKEYFDDNAQSVAIEATADNGLTCVWSSDKGTINANKLTIASKDLYNNGTAQTNIYLKVSSSLGAAGTYTVTLKKQNSSITMATFKVTTQTRTVPFFTSGSTKITAATYDLGTLKVGNTAKTTPSFNVSFDTDNWTSDDITITSTDVTSTLATYGLHMSVDKFVDHYKLTVSGDATKVAKNKGISLAVKATAGGTAAYKQEAEKTFTLTIEGEAPAIVFSADQTTKNGGTTAKNAFDISGYFQSGDNTLLLSGKTLDHIHSVNTDSTDRAFVATGSSEDLKLTVGVYSDQGCTTSVGELTYDPQYKYTVSADAKTGGISADITTASGKTLPTVKVDTVYYVKVEASNAQGSATAYYRFTVKPVPSIKATTPGAITWNDKKAYAFTPELDLDKKASGTRTWSIVSKDGEIDNAHKYFTDASNLKAITGLDFSTTDGKISGTWNTVASPDASFDIGSAASLTYKIKLAATLNGETDSKDFTLTFKPAKPTLTDKTVINKWASALTWSQDLASKDASNPTVIVATGVGSIDWIVPTGLPDGLSYDISADRSEAAKSTLIFCGTPTETFKSKGLTIKAKNGAGESSVVVTFAVGVKELSIDANLPSGDMGVGYFISQDSIGSATTDDSDSTDDTATLERGWMTAVPGPITWSAKGLPKGVTLSWDKNGDTTRAQLIGKITKTQKETEYTVTAKNAAVNKTHDFKGKITVYDAPSITTKKLADLTADKKYEVTLGAKNDAKSWDVTFSADNAGDYTHGLQLTGANYYLSFDASKLTITGSLDKMPAGGIVDVRIIATNIAGTDSKDIRMKVKGIAPALATTSLKDAAGSDGATWDITTTGTKDVYITAYIDATTAKKYFAASDSIDLTVDEAPSSAEDDDTGTGFYFVRKLNDDGNTPTGEGTLGLVKGSGKAYKNLPITFAVSNDVKKVTKALKVTVKGNTPVWYVASGDETEYTALTKDLTITATASVDLGTDGEDEAKTGYRFIVSGDDPITVTLSQKTGTANAKNGIYITSADDEDLEKTVYTIAGIPTKSKETKTTITLKATNPSTGDNKAIKITIEAKQPPEISSKASALKKEVELGKKLSIKPAAKGSKTIKWVLTGADSEDVTDELKALGLKFTSSTGELSGTTTAVTTSEEDETVYASRDYYVQAGNSAGSSDIVVYTVGIKGEKPKFAVKQVEFDRAELDFEDEKNAILKTNIKTTEAATKAHVTYAPATEAEGDKLTTLGFSATIDSEAKANYGIFTNDKDLIATKGTAVKITASNFGSEVTGNIKVIVTDPKPEIENTKGDTSISASDSDKVPEEFEFKITDDTAATGDSTIKWALKTKPKKVTAKLTDNKDGTATVTITVPKNFKNVVQGEDEDLETSFGIVATNSSLPKSPSEEYIVEFTVTPVPSQTDNSAKPEEAPADVAAAPEAEAEKSADEATEEKVAVYGKAGTVESLTEAQRSAIEEAGYIIVAVYDDVKVPEDNTYDFAFEVADGVKTGSEFAYFVFKAEEEANDDEKYAEFFDEDGAPVESVPESKKAEVSAWFSADSTYKSVVAVKADKAAADAVAESEIEEKAE